MSVIGFVPARGGSVRVQRKNLRTVGGVPLVVRTIRALVDSGEVDEVVVSTDDAEIADIASLHGARVHIRRPVTAAETIADAVAGWCDSRAPNMDGDDIIVVAQPTVLTDPATVADLVVRQRTNGAGSIITVVPERHLLWEAPAIRPLYRARRNSTTAGEPDYWRETGGLVCLFARDVGLPYPPAPVSVAVVDDAETLDIDTHHDLMAARSRVAPHRITIVYTFGHSVGTGHEYRARALASELSHHDVQVASMAQEWWTPDVPDLVIFDVLDTTAERVAAARERGVRRVVTLEDLGPGVARADVTINELYHRDGELQTGRVTLTGPAWAVLRPEFCGHPLREQKTSGPYRIVVTFGGTDPSDLTTWAALALADIDHEVVVVCPPARPEMEMTVAGRAVLSRPLMAREFLAADLVVCSAGRTVHEAAACGVPVVAVAANDREVLHDVCPGVLYLGHWSTVPSLTLRQTVEDLLADAPARQSRAALARGAVDGLGVERVAWMVEGLLGRML